MMRLRTPKRRLSIAILAGAIATLTVACEPADPIAEVRRLQRAGNYAGSIELLRPLLEERPDDGELNYLYGTALMHVGQPSVAMWPLRRAMEQPDWLARAGLELAASDLRLSNFGEAIEITDTILAAEPENIEALLLRSLARGQSRRDYVGALADADRVLELDPENLEALPARAYALLGLERTDEAGAALETLASRYRDSDFSGVRSERNCVAMALFAEEKGDVEASDQIFAGCLEEFPLSGVIVAEAVRFYDTLGRPERSLEILRAGLEKEPRHNVFRVGIANRLAAMGKREEAEQLLLEATTVEDPDFAMAAWGDLSNFYVRAGDFERGTNALEQAIALAGEPSQDLLFRYADLLVGADRFDRALEIAAKIQAPAHRQILVGRVHLERGEPKAALDSLGAALVLWPDNAVARYYAAVAAEQIGDIDRAIAEYRYSIRADAGATDARERLARLHMAEGEPDAAFTAAGHQGMEVPATPELERFWQRYYAQIGRITAENVAEYVREHRGELRPASIAAIARGAIDRSGPGGAVELIQALPGLYLAKAANSEILETLVLDLVATDRAGQARELVDTALERDPESAAYLALRGHSLEGSDADGAAAAYESALVVDPENALALAGLARFAAARGETGRALELYRRAAAVNDEDPAPQWAAAELLIEHGRLEEAERELAALLIHQPYDARVAARLADLRLDREADSEATLSLARRAVRFRGGADAYAVLARVHRQRGESDLATAAEQRATDARERAERGSTGAPPEPSP